MVSALNSSYIMKFSKHSSQVLQKCASQSNDLPASGSKTSNTREACSRQRTSVHPCFADANPLYLESSPSASAALLVRATWRDLCSQVLPTHHRHGSAWHPSQDDDQTPPGSTLHSSLASSKMTPLKCRQQRLGARAATQTSGAQPCFEASRRRQRAKYNKAALQKGLCFSYSVHFNEMKLSLVWQEYDPKSLFNYITTTLCIFNGNLPLICVCWQLEEGIQHCSRRQVGILEHPKLCGHCSVFQLEEFCLDAPCSLHARRKACNLRTWAFPLNTLSQLPASAE